MNVNIHSTVFKPVTPEEPFVVVASVLPIGSWLSHGLLRARQSSIAYTLDEARNKCCELACALRKMIDDKGSGVGAIDCSHCPTAEAPACGHLAVRRRAI